MKMNFKTITVIFLVIVFSLVMETLFANGSGLILGMAITGGPLRDLKWGGMTLRPTKDGDYECQLSGYEYEANASPNGDTYANQSSVVGYVTQECAMTQTEFNDLKKKQDGTARSGSATCPNGDVLSLNCILDGEHVLSGGKLKVKLSGKVRLQ